MQSLPSIIESDIGFGRFIFSTGIRAALPCMRIIYPTDFVRTNFSRTDEMPYKKCFHGTDIYTFLLAVSHAENIITRAENRMR